MVTNIPDILKGLSLAETDQVLALGTRITIAGGAELFRLGAEADQLFLIQRGRIRLTLPMKVRGCEEDVFVEERLPGQTVGWSALIPPHRFTLSARTLLDTELIALPRTALLAHFTARPAVGYAVSLNLASVIGERLLLFQTMWLREMQRTVELSCA